MQTLSIQKEQRNRLTEPLIPGVDSVTLPASGASIDHNKDQWAHPRQHTYLLKNTL